MTLAFYFRIFLFLFWDSEKIVFIVRDILLDVYDRDCHETEICEGLSQSRIVKMKSAKGALEGKYVNNYADIKP